MACGRPARDCCSVSSARTRRSPRAPALRAAVCSSSARARASTRSTPTSRSTRTPTRPSSTSIHSSSSTTATNTQVRARLRALLEGVERTARRGRSRPSKNAKWTDGQPLTAADAAWTINTDIKYQGGGAANAAGLIAHIRNATAPNPTTLVVHYTAAPGQRARASSSSSRSFPQHIWSKYTAHKGADLKTFANPAPVVGAGPFKLVKYQKDQIALFQRNDSFYGPKPQADGFGLQMFSNDDALVTALKAHDIDAIEDVPATTIEVAAEGGHQASAGPGRRGDRLHPQLEPEEAEEPRAPEPQSSRGVRPRDQPPADRQRRLPGHRASRQARSSRPQPARGTTRR